MSEPTFSEFFVFCLRHPNFWKFTIFIGAMMMVGMHIFPVDYPR